MATTGLGVAAKIVSTGNINAGVTIPGKNGVKLSLSGTNYPTTYQLNPNLEDVAGNEITPGTQFTLTAVANASGNTSVYTGTITGGGSNAFAGQTFVVAGFTNAANNGTFICTASSTTTLTLENAAGVAETNAATATSQESGNSLTYVSYNPSFVTVGADGLLTAVAVGRSTVEVSYPTFNNSIGAISSSNNPMNGLPINKIYAEVNVEVLL